VQSDKPVSMIVALDADVFWGIQGCMMQYFSLAAEARELVEAT